jgi:hypothetical protein
MRPGRAASQVVVAMPKDHHQTFLGHLHLVLHIPIGTERLCLELYGASAHRLDRGDEESSTI